MPDAGTFEEVIKDEEDKEGESEVAKIDEKEPIFSL